MNIGIDLGTSHSSLATQDKDGQIRILPIPQLDSATETTAHGLLPSVILYAPQNEGLPWMQGPYAAGRWARKQASVNPERAVVSAKSWLCYQRDVSLPEGADWGGVRPETASTLILEHLLSAWEASTGSKRSTLQKLVLTVPASFDPLARELTEKAARAAGIQDLTLLEEPLAAFYAWLAQHEENWAKTLSIGDLVLVCDVGGGTCDFSLIAVLEDQGELQLERIAVGRHLLLGGDNMDLALAHMLKAQHPEIDAWQLQSLQLEARVAKEALLGPDAPDSYPIAIAGRGSNLFAQTLRFDLQRSTVEDLIIDGFFPLCDKDARVERPRGLQVLGLPFEHDPAITKHLAAFLRQAASNLAKQERFAGLVENAQLKPQHILFNGGVFQAQVLQDRVARCLENWDLGQSVQVLASPDPEHAVALGAAHYAQWSAAGHKLRVRAAASRSYYLGLESNELAVPGLKKRLRGLCVLPQGTEEGSRLELSAQAFGLWTGEDVRFRLYASQERASDALGSLVPDADRDLEAIADVGCHIEGDSEEAIPVYLTSSFDETGTLELGMQETGGLRRWQLAFQLRDSHA